MKLAKRPELLWPFDQPTGITIGDHGEIIAAGAMRPRPQIYKKEYDFVDPQFNL